MELLFNKDSNGDVEIKALLPWIDADFGYENLLPDIKKSSRNLKKMISTAVYEELIGLYNADTSNDEQIELVEQAQLVIIQDAYRNFVPNFDLAHTPEGRKMRVDEHEKVPMEYMLDRSNENMERKYYEALDTLLELLASNTTWKESDEYKAMHSTWVAHTDVFKEYYPQATRLMLMQLAPGFKRAQKKEIKSRLSDVDYKAINTAVTAGSDFDDAHLEKLLELSQEIMVYKALEWGLLRLRVTLFPEGILQPYTGDRNVTKARKTPENNLTEITAQAFSNDAAQRALELELYLDSLKSEPKPLPRDGYIAKSTNKFLST